MTSSEFADFAKKHTKGLPSKRVTAWGVLFTLLVTGGAAIEESGAKARELAEQATSEELAEMAAE